MGKRSNHKNKKTRNSKKAKAPVEVSSEQRLLALFRKQHKEGTKRGEFQPLNAWLSNLARQAQGIQFLGGRVRVGDHGRHSAREVIQALRVFREEQPQYLRGVALPTELDESNFDEVMSGVYVMS